MNLHTVGCLWLKITHGLVESLHVLAEKEEKRRKDEKKKLRERRQVDAEVALRCTHPACVFVVVNKVGLTNHTPETHAAVKVHVSVLQAIISSTGSS